MSICQNKKVYRIFEFNLTSAFLTGIPVGSIKIFGEEFWFVKGKVLIFGTNFYPCSFVHF